MTISYSVRRVVWLSIMLLCTAPAFAVDQLDLLVALKTLPLLTNKISGPTVLAIIYDPTSPNSLAEANSAKNFIDAGLKAPGDIVLSAQVVSMSNLEKLTNSRIAFITKEVCTNSVSASTAAMGMLTISTDMDCIKSGRVVIGVVTKPNIEIYFSKTAADAAKIEFYQAFMMLAKKV